MSVWSYIFLEYIKDLYFVIYICSILALVSVSEDNILHAYTIFFNVDISFLQAKVYIMHWTIRVYDMFTCWYQPPDMTYDEVIEHMHFQDENL